MALSNTAHVWKLLNAFLLPGSLILYGLLIFVIFVEEVVTVASLHRYQIVRHQGLLGSDLRAQPASRRGRPGSGLESGGEASQCARCAYRGHSSMHNAVRQSSPPPQAACSAPLCTFTDGLSLGAEFFPPSGFKFIFKSYLKKFPWTPLAFSSVYVSLP